MDGVFVLAVLLAVALAAVAFLLARSGEQARAVSSEQLPSGEPSRAAPSTGARSSFSVMSRWRSRRSGAHPPAIMKKNHIEAVEELQDALDDIQVLSSQGLGAPVRKKRRREPGESSKSTERRRYSFPGVRRIFGGISPRGCTSPPSAAKASSTIFSCSVVDIEAGPASPSTAAVTSRMPCDVLGPRTGGARRSNGATSDVSCSEVSADVEELGALASLPGDQIRHFLRLAPTAAELHAGAQRHEQLRNSARQMRDAEYSLRQFFDDMLFCFPELDLYLGADPDALGTPLAGSPEAKVRSENMLAEAADTEPGGGNAAGGGGPTSPPRTLGSGRTAAAEWKRTIGALFSVYWVARLDLAEVAGSEALDGRRGFCFGVSPATWRVREAAELAAELAGDDPTLAKLAEKRQAFYAAQDWWQLHKLMVDAGILTMVDVDAIAGTRRAPSVVAGPGSMAVPPSVPSVRKVYSNTRPVGEAAPSAADDGAASFQSACGAGTSDGGSFNRSAGDESFSRGAGGSERSSEDDDSFVLRTSVLAVAAGRAEDDTGGRAAPRSPPSTPRRLRLPSSARQSRRSSCSASMSSRSPSTRRSSAAALAAASAAQQKAVVDVERMVSMLTLTAIHDIMKVEHLLPTVRGEAYCGFEVGDVIQDHDVALGYVLEYDPQSLPCFAALGAAEQRPIKFTQASPQPRPERPKRALPTPPDPLRQPPRPM